MGLHQAKVDRVLSYPCDCGADDDHSVEAEVARVESPEGETEVILVKPEKKERPAEGKGFTTTED
jgi:hypothetical protein